MRSHRISEDFACQLDRSLPASQQELAGRAREEQAASNPGTTRKAPSASANEALAHRRSRRLRPSWWTLAPRGSPKSKIDPGPVVRRSASGGRSDPSRLESPAVGDRRSPAPVPLVELDRGMSVDLSTPSDVRVIVARDRPGASRSRRREKASGPAGGIANVPGEVSPANSRLVAVGFGLGSRGARHRQVGRQGRARSAGHRGSRCPLRRSSSDAVGVEAASSRWPPRRPGGWRRDVGHGSGRVRRRCRSRPTRTGRGDQIVAGSRTETSPALVSQRARCRYPGADLIDRELVVVPPAPIRRPAFGTARPDRPRTRRRPASAGESTSSLWPMAIETWTEDTLRTAFGPDDARPSSRLRSVGLDGLLGADHQAGTAESVVWLHVGRAVEDRSRHVARPPGVGRQTRASVAPVQASLRRTSSCVPRIRSARFRSSGRGRRARCGLREPRTTISGVNLVAGFRPERGDGCARGGPIRLTGFNEALVGTDGYTMPATARPRHLAGRRVLDVVFDLSDAVVKALAGQAVLAHEMVGWPCHRPRPDRVHRRHREPDPREAVSAIQAAARRARRLGLLLQEGSTRSVGRACDQDQGIRHGASEGRQRRARSKPRRPVARTDRIVSGRSSDGTLLRLRHSHGTSS